MVMRAAWGPLFSWGARTNQTFVTVFARGQAMGLRTYRDIVMRGDFRVARARGLSPAMYRGLPRREIVPRAWLGERAIGQKQTYRYLVELKGYNLQTGAEAFRTPAIESRVPLTKNQILEKAWAEWGEVYEGAADQYVSAELIGGRGG